jgi:putative restriction endonuclease
MSPKGRRHEIVRAALAFRFSRAAPESVFMVSEPQFNLAEDTYAAPDVLVHPSAIKTPDIRGGDALLVAEIADTSLAYDLQKKAQLYASHGVREYLDHQCRHARHDGAHPAFGGFIYRDRGSIAERTHIAHTGSCARGLARCARYRLILCKALFGSRVDEGQPVLTSERAAAGRHADDAVVDREHAGDAVRDLLRARPQAAAAGRSGKRHLAVGDRH